MRTKIAAMLALLVATAFLLSACPGKQMDGGGRMSQPSGSRY